MQTPLRRRSLLAQLGCAALAACSHPCPPDAFTFMDRDSVRTALGTTPSLFQLLLLEGHEPELETIVAPTTTHLVRLIWFRAFDPLVVVRVIADSSGARVRWKVGTHFVPAGKSEADVFSIPPYLHWRCGDRLLSTSRHHALVAEVDASRFWILPEVFPSRDHGDTTFVDGASWLLEVWDHGRYHSVISDWKPDSTIRRLGLRLLSSTTLRIDSSRVY